MQHVARMAVILSGLLGLAGCAVYPAVPGYAYGPYPYYAGGYPYVAGPEVVIGGGYYGHEGWGGGYRR